MGYNRRVLKENYRRQNGKYRVYKEFTHQGDYKDLTCLAVKDVVFSTRGTVWNGNPRYIHAFSRPVLNTKENYTLSCSSAYVIITILVLLALLIGGLVVLVGYFFLQEVNITLTLLYKETVRTLPVFCEDLSLSYIEDFYTFQAKKSGLKVYVNSEGKYICEDRNFSAVIPKIVERQSRLRQSKGLDSPQFLSCGNETLARKSGDLTVSFYRISPHQQYSDDGLNVKLHWDKHITHSYIDPVIQYHNGELTLPEGRTYFVYASVHFNISRGSMNTDKSRIFTLRICRKIYDYEHTLLGKTEIFNLDKETTVASLQIANLLELNRNDTIYVKVSNANYMIPESTGTTFGLFPL